MPSEQRIACQEIKLSRDPSELVNIVTRQKDGKWEIIVVPPSDVDIFYTPPGKPRSPLKPREILWVAGTLKSGQTLTIEAKSPGTGIMPQDDYPIIYPSNMIRSGGARKGPDAWPYNLILSDASGQLAFVDPMIVIKEDP